MRSIKDKRTAREEATSTDHLDLSKAERVSMPNWKFPTETIPLRMPALLLAFFGSPSDATPKKSDRPASFGDIFTPACS
jgi:hypothetical protein